MLVKKIIKNIRVFRNRKDCNGLWQGQGGGELNQPQYVKKVCEDGPDYFENFIWTPVITTLTEYRNYVSGEIAYTPSSLKTRIKGLVASIHRYVLVSSYFGDNFVYLYSQDEEEQYKYRNEIFDLNSRLMGCNDRPIFNIQDIASKAGIDGYHVDILKYMKHEKCNSIKRERLKWLKN